MTTLQEVLELREAAYITERRIMRLYMTRDWPNHAESLHRFIINMDRCSYKFEAKIINEHEFIKRTSSLIEAMTRFISETELIRISLSP